MKREMQKILRTENCNVMLSVIQNALLQRLNVFCFLEMIRKYACLAGEDVNAGSTTKAPDVGTCVLREMSLIRLCMTTSNAEHARIASLIAEVALLRGTFTLRSGRVSNFYLDKYLFSTRPELLERIGVLLAEKIREVEKSVGMPVKRLAGAELGGIPLVTVASLKTGLPCVFVRNKKKDYGTSKQLEGVINKGDITVLVEDVATTAGQALEAVTSLREAGADVRAVIATIDRQEGARENVEKAGMSFVSLFTKHDLGIRE